MIVVTGGAGFIGSNVINHLLVNKEKVISVDWHKKENYSYFIRNNFKKISPDVLEDFLNKNKKKISIILHLGAITSTTENDLKKILKNNVNLSLYLWNWCLKNKKRFIYASSAATYGDGKNGFNDLNDKGYLAKLLPLNLYGWSKHVVDQYVWNNKKTNSISQCVGLKFFNVYGPNEFHKKDMRSIVLKIYENIQAEKTINLFKSHNKNYKDGEQLRDFIFVKDVVDVVYWFIKNPRVSGLFNLGSSIPQSFNTLAKLVYRYCNKKKKINYIPTPLSIRNQYQYFTKADIKKLKNVGYKTGFTSLEDGIKDYITKYLNKS
ncbi:MAG: ADP-glyceromanno-heptose 6-epimerase [Alphaproteobacteria bacterium]